MDYLNARKVIELGTRRNDKDDEPKDPDDPKDTETPDTPDAPADGPKK